MRYLELVKLAKLRKRVVRSIKGDMKRNPEFISTTVGRIAHNLHESVFTIKWACENTPWILMANQEDYASNIEIWVDNEPTDALTPIPLPEQPRARRAASK